MHALTLWGGNHRARGPAAPAAAPGKTQVSVLPEQTPLPVADDDDEPVVHRKSRRTSVAGESLKPEDFSSATKVVHPKSPEVKVRLSQLVSKLLLFRTLDQHQVAGTLSIGQDRARERGSEGTRKGARE